MPLTPRAHDPSAAPLWRVAAVAGALWLVPGLLVALQTLAVEGGDRPRVLVPLALVPWLLWALATPAIVATARRVPFDRGVARAVAAHLALGLPLVLAMTTATAWAYHATGAMPGRSFQEVWMLYAGARMVVLLFIYAGVVGVVEYAATRRRAAGEAERATRLAAEAQALEGHLARAQLDALRLQLDPHVLFNTLNTIAGLVRSDQPDRAVRMIARVADLLRFTLDRSTAAEAPLADELEHVGLYLDVERVRFGDRLHVVLDVDPAVGAALVPSLVVQPLVENAVRHGLAPRPDGGTVWVSARRVDNRLVVAVEDDGVGLAEVCPVEASSGIGLRNTRERLRRLYGVGGSLELDGRPGGGTRAVLTVPYRPAESLEVIASEGDEEQTNSPLVAL